MDLVEVWCWHWRFWGDTDGSQWIRDLTNLIFCDSWVVFTGRNMSVDKRGHRSTTTHFYETNSSNLMRKRRQNKLNRNKRKRFFFFLKNMAPLSWNVNFELRSKEKALPVYRDRDMNRDMNKCTSQNIGSSYVEYLALSSSQSLQYFKLQISKMEYTKTFYHRLVGC